MTLRPLLHHKQAIADFCHYFIHYIIVWPTIQYFTAYRLTMVSIASLFREWWASLDWPSWLRLPRNRKRKSKTNSSSKANQSSKSNGPKKTNGASQTNKNKANDKSEDEPRTSAKRTGNSKEFHSRVFYHWMLLVIAYCAIAATEFEPIFDLPAMALASVPLLVPHWLYVRWPIFTTGLLVCWDQLCIRGLHQRLGDTFYRFVWVV